ncbi:putative geraniol 8-hydroxylase [Medicago truncatula]|uniref:Cytochrome P450 family protein n=1 Tax=Medicago truncatula TaxID=3880 RepID=A0A072VPG2_MEDTR|nr:geraniol 8-hydroxylase [Medicago truncatula]KEH43874.1 cytochrome P450 family protein [Medicago truncatula]RHN82018.1 putative geraniol 8-hydroxylase [Medicago truncatula]
MDFPNSMFLIVLTCVTIIVFLRSFFARITKPNYKLPPGPSPLPIIGNLLELGEKPHKSLANLTKIHGSIISLKFGRITTVVVSSANMAKEVLLTNDQFLSNRTIPQSVSVLNHEHYSLAFIPVAPLWKELRKICNTQLFSHKTLDASQDVRRKKMQQLLNDINQSSQIGEAIDIGTAVFKTTINLLSNTIFSVDLIQSNGEAGEFKDLVTNITKLVGSPNVADFFPILKMLDPQGVKRKQAKNVRKVLDIFEDLVNQRLKVREANGVDTNKDMLDAMLNISKDNEFMDKNMIQHLSHDLFVAGTDTTASTLEWAMTELIRNPEAMLKAKKELGKMIGCSVPLEESDISKLPYLQAIIKETLRLHPPVPLLLPRKAERNVDIGGYTIPKDAQVMVNVWTIGRDPTIWLNPTLFSPERFLGSDIDVKGRNFELVPFGAGRRICPGLQLANRMLLLMLGSLVNSFDWKLEGDMKPEDMDMNDKFGITLQKAQPLRVVPVRISK